MAAPPLEVEDARTAPIELLQRLRRRRGSGGEACAHGELGSPSEQAREQSRRAVEHLRVVPVDGL
jgi:hypothetical protein